MNATAPCRVAIGADHGGYDLKESLKAALVSLGHAVVDCGTHSRDPVDYPDLAHAVAGAVAESRCDRGIVIDGAGIGSSIAANKVPGIRAACCHDLFTVKNSREHNNANVLSLGSMGLGAPEAIELARVWLETPFAGGRHSRRIEKISAVEYRYLR
ncbi:MAG: ribose 5-phosphate isomerase B [Planctomycetes bacterium]|nr:ribose 5-phosphate isomerase B [Planctomycetota bacterium]